MNDKNPTPMNIENTNPFAEMDNAVNGFFNAIDNLVNAAKEVEEKKMVFTITRTAHYKGEKPKGVFVVETMSFEGLESEGFWAEDSLPRAKFVGNYGRDHKQVCEMTVGTILKSQAGEYIQRIK